MQYIRLLLFYSVIFKSVIFQSVIFQSCKFQSPIFAIAELLVRLRLCPRLRLRMQGRTYAAGVTAGALTGLEYQAICSVCGLRNLLYYTPDPFSTPTWTWDYAYEWMRAPTMACVAFVLLWMWDASDSWPGATCLTTVVHGWITAQRCLVYACKAPCRCSKTVLNVVGLV